MKPNPISKLFVIGLVFVAACGSGAANQDLIGTWQRLRDDASLRDQYTFGRDGTFAFDELKPDDPATEDHLSGTYQATDRTVVANVTQARDGRPARLTFSWFANATSFSTAALLPTGAHQGIVGGWDGIVKIERLDEPGSIPDGASTAQTFRADGTFTATTTRHDGSAATVVEGTYVEDPPGLFTATAVTATGPSVMIAQLIDGAALVGPSRIWTKR